MSQKATRKPQNSTPVTEEKEKVDTPVKEMKKKMAANAEKDKQAAEKAEKPTEKIESADKSKPAENADKVKPTEKADKIKPAENAVKIKPAEKADKNIEKTDKNGEKTDKNKNADNKDKPAEKKTDKSEKAAEKKSDKSSDKKPAEKKSETQVDKDESKGEKAKEKPSKAVNGTHNGSASNGDDLHGTVKATKTPDTPAPRPASERESDDSKESKTPKPKDDSVSSDRKLRSSDSPRPDAKKLEKKANELSLAQHADQEEKKATKKDLETVREIENEPKDGEPADRSNHMETEVVIEVESTEGVAPRTRARVSPYSRTRLDRTTTSVMADYTGNNSTMEMDITETSSLMDEPSLNDSGYLRGLRGIRGRTSYKVLKELKLTNPNAGRARPAPTATVRPTGAVVGRKRKPSTEVTAAPTSPTSTPIASATILSGVEAGEEVSEDIFLAHGKRMKLLDRLALPFRRSITSRPAEIVGINTDLPLTAPVASTSFATFDPESMKPAPPSARPSEPVATPLVGGGDRDNKRCVVM